MCYIFLTVYKIRFFSEIGVNPVFPVHHLDFINYCPDIQFVLKTLSLKYLAITSHL